jgi:hypothetical protein
MRRIHIPKGIHQFCSLARYFITEDYGPTGAIWINWPRFGYQYGSRMSGLYSYCDFSMVSSQAHLP